MGPDPNVETELHCATRYGLMAAATQWNTPLTTFRETTAQFGTILSMGVEAA